MHINVYKIEIQQMFTLSTTVRAEVLRAFSELTSIHEVVLNGIATTSSAFIYL